MDIPKNLGNMDQLLKRFKDAVTRFELFRSLHQEAFDYAVPNRETFRQYSPGERKNRQIFDSTAVLGAQQFANRIQTALLPSWSHWMNFEAGNEIPEQERAGVKEALQEITNIFFGEINHSNFYSELNPSLLDLSVGTGAIIVDEQPFGSTSNIRFINVPLSECYPELPGSGPIMSLWRKQKIAPKNIQNEWPQAKLPKDLQKRADKNDPTETEILNAMLHDPKDNVFHQLVIHEESKTLLFTQTFKSKRFICFRWSVTPGEVYGRGPVIQALPDIRTANKCKQFILENAAINMSGMYTAAANSHFNPYTVRVRPGAIIPVGPNGNSNTNPALRPLDRSGDLGMGQIVLQDLQATINRALFADPLGTLDDPVRSATEIMIRNQEMLKNAGASFGRLRTELVEPLVLAVLDVLTSRGVVPELRVDGKEVEIKMVSPLAKAEALEDFQTTQTFLGALSQTLPPELLPAIVAVEEIPTVIQEALGADQRLLRNEEQREQIAAQAVQQVGPAMPGEGEVPVE